MDRDRKLDTERERDREVYRDIKKIEREVDWKREK